MSHYLQLRSITCLGKNLRLQELYAQNNELVTITGSLEHLTNLETLSLHNNQLQKLEVVVHELRKLNKLKTVSECLFGLITLCVCGEAGGGGEEREREGERNWERDHERETYRLRKRERREVDVRKEN